MQKGGDEGPSCSSEIGKRLGLRKERRKKKKGEKATADCVSGRWQAGSLSRSQLRLCTKVPSRAVLFRPCKRTCVMIGPRNGMIVVVTVARQREIRNAIGTRGTRRTCRSDFEKGGTPFHPHRPVNSSFRSSFLSFSLRPSPFSPRARFLRPLFAPAVAVYVLLISCGMARRRGRIPKVSWDEPPPKRKIRSAPSRATFFFALCGKTESFMLKFKAACALD